MTTRNPFEYVGANDLPGDIILDYYIEDFNFSRFIQSTRNVLLVGERGCGKSMTLLYNSFPVQLLRAARDRDELPLDLIGVYVPCNSPLTHKREFQLLDEFRASVISEHHLALSMAYGIARTLAHAPDLLSTGEESILRGELSYLFETDLPVGDVFKGLMQLTERESIRAQRAANSRTSTDVFYENTFSFPSLIVPMLRVLRSVKKLAGAHFAFLLDDAHDLNEYQRRALFSWIAYRDHSLFSFKVAIANVSRSSLVTASGGSILEGHDYTRIDMIQPFQNEDADFGHLADLMIKRRLEKCGISTTPQKFFPVSSQMLEQLQRSEDVVRREALEKYGDDKGKASDYLYKYKRAHFFRNRPVTANRPEYSGFDTLVFLSTGVVRNLLMPCYWMYDKVLSLAALEEESTSDVAASGARALPTEIPPAIQSEIILARSRSLWDWARNELDKSLEGCSGENATHAYQLLDNLAILFRERLLRHKSEPRANSFTISRQGEPAMAKLRAVIDILVAAQLMYVRSGAAKDKGKRENYYVPNRMLWPDRGLDPHGQHARVSIPSTDLWAAAEENRAIPFDDGDDRNSKQPKLFDEN